MMMMPKCALAAAAAAAISHFVGLYTVELMAFVHTVCLYSLSRAVCCLSLLVDSVQVAPAILHITYQSFNST